jgi:uncharacterized protein YfaQ (DUF2300 family)
MIRDASPQSAVTPETAITLAPGVERALEQAPTVAIPDDFAARVRASLPAQPVAATRPSAARVSAIAAAAVSLVALSWLAPHAAPNFDSMAFDLEMVLLAELAMIAAWLGVAWKKV